MKPQPELIDLDPETLSLDCFAAELGDRRFDMEARGYLITSETATEHGWRIEARRCDCDVCADGRKARARAVAESQKAKPVTPSQGREFFARLRQEISKA